jgi:hypothetical protein
VACLYIRAIRQGGYIMRMRRNHLIFMISGTVLSLVLAFSVLRKGPSPVPQVAPYEHPSRYSEASRSSPASSPDATKEPNPSSAQAGADSRVGFIKWEACYRASRLLAVSKQNADCKFYEGKPEPARGYEECLSHWVERHDRMEAAQAALSGCGNDDVAILDHYYSATKAAAKAGDPDAQLCYLQSDFEDSAGAPRSTGADIEEYKSLAPGFTANAFPA